MCSGVEMREKFCQLSGWMKVLEDSIKINTKIIAVKPKSLKITEIKKLLPSAMSLPCLLGELRWRITKCARTTAREIIAKRKWITVNLRNDQDETVVPPRRKETISLPKRGTTVKRFKITKAAQKLILPETKT